MSIDPKEMLRFFKEMKPGSATLEKITLTNGISSANQVLQLYGVCSWLRLLGAP
jgi:hypothetical protein